MPTSRLRTCPIGRCSPIAMPSGVTIQTTLLSSAATPIRNTPSGTAQNAAASGGPPEAQVTRPGTPISSTAPPEPAPTSLSLREDPLRSRTSSGGAAACIVGGKHHGRRGHVKRQKRVTIIRQAEAGLARCVQQSPDGAVDLFIPRPQGPPCVPHPSRQVCDRASSCAGFRAVYLHSGSERPNRES